MKYSFQFLKNLPVYQKKDEILEAIRDNQVVIISGETGSGKTTQLPLICLEGGFGKNGVIGCTQPRRIAAVSLANFTNSCFSDPGQNIAGYKIRFHEKLADQTKIKFMTDGILLAEIAQDRLLRQYDVLIIDEAHERSLNIDFLLGYLRSVLQQRNDLRLIISSATLNTKLFSRAFNNAPVITISGRLYPVEIRYSPVIELWKGQSMDSCIDGVIASVSDIVTGKEPGDILIFLPTIEDVAETVQRLEGIYKYDGFRILPLHSRISPVKQSEIFKHFDTRKIVVATNIAETSITVPGIRFVIDSGLARMLSYDPGVGFSRMPIARISRSSAEQRAGRCGRVSGGICIRLYSEQDFLSRPLFSTPELRRANLSGVILRMLHFGLGDAFKFPFLQHPSPKSIYDGYRRLRELGAVDKRNNLTALGFKMARMPLDPPLSRMLLDAGDRGVLREMLIIAAALSTTDLFGYGKEKTAAFRHRGSDFMGFVNLWDAFHGSIVNGKQSNSSLRNFCEKYNLSRLKMREWFDAHRQLQKLCKPLHRDVQVQKKDVYDAVHKCLLVGLFHGIAVRVDSGVYHGIHSGQIHLFPASALFGTSHQWVLFHEIVETSKIYGHIAAEIKPRWIEEIFRKQCHYNWNDPFYDPETGTVLAYEEVLFHGLQLVKNRVITLNVRDRKTAHEVFIHDALVKELIGDRYRFVNVNRVCRNTITSYEQKLRMPLYAGDPVLFDIYDELLPGVTSEKELCDTIRNHGNDSFLFVKIRELCICDIPDEITDYPDTLTIAGERVPVVYNYCPGKDYDGVTLVISEILFRSVPIYYWEWAVPVLWKNRVQWVIDYLLGEIPDKTDVLNRIYDAVAVPDGHFTDVLTSVMSKLFDFGFDTEQIIKNIPSWLWADIEIRDVQGIVLDRCRPPRERFALPHTWYGIRSSLWEQCAAPYEGDFDGVWEDKNFLKRIPLYNSRQAVPFCGYPALYRNLNSVQTRVFQSPSEAYDSHRDAVQYLVEQKIAEPLAWELENVQVPPNIKSNILKVIDEEGIDDLIVNLSLKKIIDLSQVLPCRLSEFESVVSDASKKIDGMTEQIIHLVDTVSDHFCKCRALFRKRLERHRYETSPNIRAELERMFESYREAITADHVPIHFLENMPEFLQCFYRVIETGFLEPGRYRERMNAVAVYTENLPPVGQINRYFEEWNTRCMVESFKCSLFTEVPGNVNHLLTKQLNQLKKRPE